MPRKQRFKPSRKPKLADGTMSLQPLDKATLTVALPTPPESPLAARPPAPRPVRGRDAVIDD